ncbi:MAG: hypothetical protein FWH11_11520 [Micrococcales bacterium]|nr:hypothetical protein [Micrococcales bacterium]
MNEQHRHPPLGTDGQRGLPRSWQVGDLGQPQDRRVALADRSAQRQARGPAPGVGQSPPATGGLVHHVGLRSDSP